MKAFRVLLASLLCLLVTNLARGADDDDDYVKTAQKVLAKATIDLTKAISIAQEKVPNGKPIYAVTEEEDDKLLFEVFLLVGKSVTEVEIDVATGKIVEIEQDENDEIDDLPDVRKALKGTKITLAQAIASAAAKVKGGKPFEVSIEMSDDNKPAVYVEILDGDKVMEAEVDAASGKVLSVDEATD